MSALQDRAGAEPVTIDIEPNVAAPDAADATALVVASVYANPVVVYQNPDSLDAFYDAMERKVNEFVPDVSTPTTRKKIASLAFEVARAKTSLDDAGKELNAAKRAEIDKVDEARRSLRDRFDALRDRAKQPLVDWEAAEERRKAAVDRDLAELRDAGLVFNDDTIAELEERLAKVEGMAITVDHFGTFATEAEGRRLQAITALKAGIERKHEEAEREIAQAARDAELEAAREELAQLRALQQRQAAAEAARIEAERVEREAAAKAAREKEAAELAAKEAAAAAERAEEQRRQDELEAQQRMIEAQAAEARRVEAAAERARQEAAEAAAQREREIEERHAAELRRIEEEAAQKERERLAAEKAAEDQRQAELRRLAAEEERRQADKRHRAKIKVEVIASILASLPSLSADLLSTRDDDLISDIVEAIAAGKIAHTSIQF